MAERIQNRRDTAANWTTVNPILAQGELGIETDTLKIKCGNGTQAWNSLVYLINTGDYLTDANTRTLTNKTINGSNNTITNVSLTSGVTGTLPVANGGTGSTTLTANNVLLGNGTSAVQAVAPGTSGNVLTSNGTTWQSSASFSTSADNTYVGTQSFTGTSSKLAMVLNDAAEVALISGASVTGSLTVDVTTSSVVFYQGNATGNWSINIRASSGTPLNTAMSTGQSVTIAVLVQQGGTAYFNNSVQIDGTTSGVTTRWLGGTPTAGNANGIDSYRYLIIKTGSATYTVLASVAQFKV